jgi:hypothetical protein
VFVSAAACTLLVGARTASAQAVWSGGTTGDLRLWRIPGNWQSGHLPNANEDTTVGMPGVLATSIIESNLIAQTRDLAIGNQGRIELLGGGGHTLTINGDLIANDGVIVVNSGNFTGGANTVLTIVAAASLEGDGAIVLGAAGLSSQLVSGVSPFTQQESHTIRGEGTITANFVNYGLIRAEDDDADGASAGVLEIANRTSNSKTNNGVIASSPSSELSFHTTISQGATGRIVADTSVVHLYNSTFSGGAFESTGGGYFDTVGNSLRLDGVHNSARIDMISVSSVVPTVNIGAAGIVNDGTIVVKANEDAGPATIFLAGDVTGSGEIILNRQGSATLSSSGATPSLNGADHTIRGVGAINAALVNDGTIVAEARNGGTVLELNQQGTSTIFNRNVIRADAGATLRLRTVVLSQDPGLGRLIANDGVVELHANAFNTSLVSGGRFETVGAGKFEVAFNTRIQDVVNAGVLNVRPATELRLAGTTFTNDDTVDLKAQCAPACNSASITFENNIALDGNGEIVLDAHAGTAFNRINVATGATVTQSAAHTIRGEGVFNTGGNLGTFVNDGQVLGNSPTETIAFNGTLAGDGLLKDVRINGTHAVGNGPSGSGLAVVPLTGSYTVNIGTGRVALDVGGVAAGQYDQLASTDPTNRITIGGGGTRLMVSLVNAYVPSIGDAFTFISTAGQIEGTFTAFDLPTLPVDRTWEVQSNSHEIVGRVVVGSTFLSGDIDRDHDVDVHDARLFSQFLGKSSASTWETGDFDGDGLTTIVDFGLMQSNLGQALPSPTASASAVPEPNGALLFACAAIALVANRILRR